MRPLVPLLLALCGAAAQPGGRPAAIAPRLVSAEEVAKGNVDGWFATVEVTARDVTPFPAGIFFRATGVETLAIYCPPTEPCSRAISEGGKARFTGRVYLAGDRGWVNSSDFPVEALKAFALKAMNREPDGARVLVIGAVPGGPEQASLPFWPLELGVGVLAALTGFALLAFWKGMGRVQGAERRALEKERDRGE